MDPRLDFLLKRHNVHLKLNQNIQRPAYMTKLPTHTELAVQFGVHGEELTEVVAIQLARLMLGQLERLNKDGDTKLAEWRQAVLAAARLLIPDDRLAEAERQGWDAGQLAEACGVTELMARARLEERLIERELVPYLPDGTNWDDLIRALQNRLE